MGLGVIVASVRSDLGTRRAVRRAGPVAIVATGRTGRTLGALTAHERPPLAAAPARSR